MAVNSRAYAFVLSKRDWPRQRSVITGVWLTNSFVNARFPREPLKVPPIRFERIRSLFGVRERWSHDVFDHTDFVAVGNYTLHLFMFVSSFCEDRRSPPKGNELDWVEVKHPSVWI